MEERGRVKQRSDLYKSIPIIMAGNPDLMKDVKREMKRRKSRASTSSDSNSPPPKPLIPISSPKAKKKKSWGDMLGASSFNIFGSKKKAGGRRKSSLHLKSLSSLAVGEDVKNNHKKNLSEPNNSNMFAMKIGDLKSIKLKPRGNEIWSSEKIKGLEELIPSPIKISPVDIEYDDEGIMVTPLNKFEIEKPEHDNIHRLVSPKPSIDVPSEIRTSISNNFGAPPLLSQIEPTVSLKVVSAEVLELGEKSNWRKSVPPPPRPPSSNAKKLFQLKKLSMDSTDILAPMSPSSSSPPTSPSTTNPKATKKVIKKGETKKIKNVAKRKSLLAGILSPPPPPHASPSSELTIQPVIEIPVDLLHHNVVINKLVDKEGDPSSIKTNAPIEIEIEAVKSPPLTISIPKINVLESIKKIEVKDAIIDQEIVVKSPNYKGGISPTDLLAAKNNIGRKQAKEKEVLELSKTKEEAKDKNNVVISNKNRSGSTSSLKAVKKDDPKPSSTPPVSTPQSGLWSSPLLHRKVMNDDDDDDDEDDDEWADEEEKAKKRKKKEEKKKREQEEYAEKARSLEDKNSTTSKGDAVNNINEEERSQKEDKKVTVWNKKKKDTSEENVKPPAKDYWAVKVPSGLNVKAKDGKENIDFWSNTVRAGRKEHKYKLKFDAALMVAKAEEINTKAISNSKGVASLKVKQNEELESIRNATDLKYSTLISKIKYLKDNILMEKSERVNYDFPDLVLKSTLFSFNKDYDEISSKYIPSILLTSKVLLMTWVNEQNEDFQKLELSTSALDEIISKDLLKEKLSGRRLQFCSCDFTFYNNKEKAINLKMDSILLDIDQIIDSTKTTRKNDNELLDSIKLFEGVLKNIKDTDSLEKEAEQKEAKLTTELKVVRDINPLEILALFISPPLWRIKGKKNKKFSCGQMRDWYTSGVLSNETLISPCDNGLVGNGMMQLDALQEDDVSIYFLPLNKWFPYPKRPFIHVSLNESSNVHEKAPSLTKKDKKRQLFKIIKYIATIATIRSMNKNKKLYLGHFKPKDFENQIIKLADELKERLLSKSNGEMINTQVLLHSNNNESNLNDSSLLLHFGEACDSNLSSSFTSNLVPSSSIAVALETLKDDQLIKDVSKDIFINPPSIKEKTIALETNNGEANRIIQMREVGIQTLSESSTNTDSTHYNHNSFSFPCPPPLMISSNSSMPSTLDMISFSNKDHSSFEHVSYSKSIETNELKNKNKINMESENFYSSKMKSKSNSCENNFSKPLMGSGSAHAVDKLKQRVLLHSNGIGSNSLSNNYVNTMFSPSSIDETNDLYSDFSNDLYSHASVTDTLISNIQQMKLKSQQIRIQSLKLIQDIDIIGQMIVTSDDEERNIKRRNVLSRVLSKRMGLLFE